MLSNKKLIMVSLLFMICSLAQAETTTPLKCETITYDRYENFRNLDYTNYNKMGFKYWSSEYNTSCDISVKASSSAAGYPPEHAIDRDLNTAWVEGKPDAGIGEWISITIAVKNTEPVRKEIVIKSIYISPAIRNSQYYDKNNRIKKMECLISTNNKEYHRELLFEDIPNIFSAPIYVIAEGDCVVKKNLPVTITLKIMEVYPGNIWNDSCISHIELFGNEF